MDPVEREEKKIMIWEVMKRYDQYADYGFLHDDENSAVFVGNWNDIPGYVERYIDYHFENSIIHFSDEVSTCSDCYGIIETIPGCYGDLPDYWTGDDFIQCKTCAKNDDFEGYVEMLVDNPNHANVLMNVEDLESKYFFKLESDFETGFHPGQNDDPTTLLKNLFEKYPGQEFIFQIDGAGQFDVNWSVYSRNV